MRWLYSLVLYALLPLVLLRLVWRGFKQPAYWRRWGERFGFGASLPPATTSIWVHAVSVGEVQAAVPLVGRFLTQYPDARVLVTTSTPTGSERVVVAFAGRVTHRYLPYDLPGAVERFLENVKPTALIVLETELWPNLFYQCARRGIPILLANVRLSARSARGYRRVSRFTSQMLQQVTLVAAQTDDDRRRLESLGAPPERIRVTGSVKFDVRLPASLQEEAQVLRRLWGVGRGVWIAASTHEGEDEQVLDAFKRVLRSVPDCLLVLVPRHPERFRKTAALCRKRGYHTVLRSDPPEKCDGVDVFVGDTMGELPLFYAAADVAFVGGSLVDTGGHNILEPCALGVPVIVGPYVHNFAEINRRLSEVGACRNVSDASGLGRTVVELLDDANLRHILGERGRVFVEGNRGALDHVMSMADEVLRRGLRKL